MSETNEYTVATGPAKGAHVKCTVTEGPPSGREMDAWIAEHVCGWVWMQGSGNNNLLHPDRVKSAVALGMQYGRNPDRNWIASINMPHYSTDPAAALEAEGRVPEESRYRYHRELCFVTDAFMDLNSAHSLFSRDWNLLRRTPAQICQAIWMAMEAHNGK